MALFILFNSFLFSQLIPNSESSSIFIKKDNLLDSSRINSVLNFANKNNIDKLFIEVFSDGFALYNSNIIPKYTELDSLFDPLNYFLNASLNYNIEIHATINTYLLWSDSIPPQDKNHFYYKCEDCFESDFNGKSDRKINLFENQSKNWEGVFLSPTHPDVNPYLLSIIDDLLNNYNIDGINLNYIRYQDSYYGYNNAGLLDFISTYDFDPRDLNRGLISTRFGYEQNQIDSLHSMWNSYRSNKISELVRSIKYKLIDDSLNVIMSASVKPNYIESKDRWYQDWVSWIDENLLDFVIIENYDFNDSFLYNNKILIENKFKYINQNKVYLGINPNFLNIKDIPEQLFFSRILGFKNFCISSYDIEKDTLDFYKPLFNVIDFNIY